MAVGDGTVLHPRGIKKQLRILPDRCAKGQDDTLLKYHCAVTLSLRQSASGSLIG